MRIIFCGTPDYAVPSLRRLATLAPHEVVGVVSQPDRPKGRSSTPTPPPVVEVARALKIPDDRIFQPRSINKPEILEKLRALQPDLLCVIAYGNLLKQDALSLAKILPINAHASLLPKYRGAGPIQAALLNGESETGVCIMKMELGLDTGPVLLEQRIPIHTDDTAGTLHDRLAELSAGCFAQAITKIESGNYSLVPQNDAVASYAPKLDKNSGKIDWMKSAVEIDRLVRAMTPWPGTWTTVSSPDGKTKQRLRVAKAAPAASIDAQAGVGIVADNELRVQTGDGSLRVSAVQPEGKREMKVVDFLNGSGRPFCPNSVWI